MARIPPRVKVPPRVKAKMKLSADFNIGSLDYPCVVDGRSTDLHVGGLTANISITGEPND
jgi:hypothetical protein